MKRIFCLAAAAGAVALLPASASASTKNFLGGGGVVAQGGFNFGTGVVGNTDGTNVNGEFTFTSRQLDFTVRATCLNVVPGLGGRNAGAAGTIIAPAALAGFGIYVRAFDSDIPGVPDEYGITGSSTTPFPTCPALAQFGLFPLQSGNITIRQGT